MPSSQIARCFTYQGRVVSHQLVTQGCRAQLLAAAGKKESAMSLTARADRVLKYSSITSRPFCCSRFCERYLQAPRRNATPPPPKSHKPLLLMIADRAPRILRSSVPQLAWKRTRDPRDGRPTCLRNAMLLLPTLLIFHRKRLIPHYRNAAERTAIISPSQSSWAGTFATATPVTSTSSSRTILR